MIAGVDFRLFLIATAKGEIPPSYSHFIAGAWLAEQIIKPIAAQ
jgi:hypothetical protein